MSILFVVFTGTYKDTFYVSGYERNLLWTRKELYRRELWIVGRYNIFNNALEKTKFTLDKITRKVAQPLDLTRYFSTDNSSFYHFIFFPLGALGLSVLIFDSLLMILGYLIFVSLIGIFAQPNYSYYLFLPLINLSILWGLINLKRIFRIKPNE